MKPCCSFPCLLHARPDLCVIELHGTRSLERQLVHTLSEDHSASLQPPSSPLECTRHLTRSIICISRRFRLSSLEYTASVRSTLFPHFQLLGVEIHDTRVTAASAALAWRRLDGLCVAESSIEQVGFSRRSRSGF
jgi:hypothetical protein